MKLIKDTLFEIKSTYKRFFSILFIIILGVGFFAGIKVASIDMKKSADNYLDKYNLMDFKLVSTMGFSKENIEEISKVEGIDGMMPSHNFHALISSDKVSLQSVATVHTMPLNHDDNNHNYLNRLNITTGTFPSSENECIVEESFLKENKLKIGDTITLKIENVNDEKVLKNEKFKIVGTANSPYYISMERGSTTLGTGSVSSFIYILENAINLDMYTEVYVTVNGAKEKLCYSEKYEKVTKSVKNKIDKAGEKIKDARYDELVTSKYKEIEDAKIKIADAKVEIEDKEEKARNDIDDAQKKLTEGELELVRNEEKSKAEIKNGEEQILSAEKEIAKNEANLKVLEKEAIPRIEQAKAALEEAKKQINPVKEGIDTKQKQIDKLKSEKEEIDKKIEITIDPLEKAELEKKSNDLDSEIKEKQKDIEKDKTYLKVLETQIEPIKLELDKQEKKLIEGRVQLEAGKKEIVKQKQKLNNAKKVAATQIAAARKKIEDGKADIEEAKNTLKTEIKNGETEISDKEKELINAKEKLDEIQRPKWYTLDRNANQSYKEYEENANKIEAIGKVFPLVFFLVAALVSLTTMTRMIEEKRTEIGTYKALGYSRNQITGKYILYALLATLIGSLIGLCIGFTLLPKLIYDAYGIMYTLGSLQIEFNLEYAFYSTAIAVLLTTLSTVYVAKKELKETPAELMRPKAPKLGKRVFLERVTFIWDRLSFIQKVTSRNIFRYKKKFLMTVIGIAGCTALILTGFVLKDSIMKIVPKQYDNIFNYDMFVALKSNLTTKEIKDTVEEIKKLEPVNDIIEVNQQSIESTVDNEKVTAYMVAMKDNQELNDMIRLQNRRTKKSIKLNDNTAVITEKYAKVLGLEVGDMLPVQDLNGKTFTLEIGAITENYVMHYVYITEKLYNEIYKEPSKTNLIYTTLNEIPNETKKEMAKEMLEKENIQNVQYTKEMTKSIEDSMKSLNSVVVILIVSAGALAFIVLYNLSNINISERIREIATIKVLGFNDREVAQYLSRESVFLTLIGIVVGLLFGVVLSNFVITTCEVDVIMFGRDIKITSYIYSVVMTLIFTFIINLVTHFVLKKVDMIQSLKSVE